MRRIPIYSVISVLAACFALDALAQPSPPNGGRPPRAAPPTGGPGAGAPNSGNRPDSGGPRILPVPSPGAGNPNNGNRPNPGGPKIPPGPGPGRRTRPSPPRPPIRNWPHRFQLNRYRPPQGYFLHQWAVGESLPGLFRTQVYWISAPGLYGLPHPRPGTHWVRVDDDALLVSDHTGRIVEVAYNIFY
jgi:Ni/Co efflux regulator RcnB